MATTSRAAPWSAFDHLDLDGAAARIAGRVSATPLTRLPQDDPRIDLRGKLENRQVTGSFKARGALNNLLSLAPEAKARGVVASSSGNHGRALAWAARSLGVPATIVMPKDAYANKIDACRAEGATVVLAETRDGADELTEGFVRRGLALVHPYDLVGTVEGASTVGREIALEWPDVEVVLVCVGGGGLVAGTSLALRRALGDRVRILGVEPLGAPSMTLGLAAAKPVRLGPSTSAVQGLCPPYSGALNIAVCRATVDGMIALDDDVIFDAQRRLVQPDEDFRWPDGTRGYAGERVEPAGAAAYAAVIASRLPEAWLAGRSASDPLRVAVTVSGGNPDPAQLAALQRPRGEEERPART